MYGGHIDTKKNTLSIRVQKMEGQLEKKQRLETSAVDETQNFFSLFSKSMSEQNRKMEELLQILKKQQKDVEENTNLLKKLEFKQKTILGESDIKFFLTWPKEEQVDFLMTKPVHSA